MIWMLTNPLLFGFLRINTRQSRAGTPNFKEKTHQSLSFSPLFSILKKNAELRKEFSSLSEAIQSASELSLNDFDYWKEHWDEFGYEWSVFELENQKETKIWEGYKFIQGWRANGKASINVDWGMLR